MRLMQGHLMSKDRHYNANQKHTALGWLILRNFRTKFTAIPASSCWSVPSGSRREARGSEAGPNLMPLTLAPLSARKTTGAPRRPILYAILTNRYPETDPVEEQARDKGLSLAHGVARTDQIRALVSELFCRTPMGRRQALGLEADYSAIVGHRGQGRPVISLPDFCLTLPAWPTTLTPSCRRLGLKTGIPISWTDCGKRFLESASDRSGSGATIFGAFHQPSHTIDDTH
ncbi:hypothetical protein NM208_g14481 [Fusarium decemcellulare]|uniref:Uncharacterized protein n=1 Tax=Fusarium decemcellulare TaxID=57161 RepID=A0ACC1RFV6_9HYPO|nr:hypothetical protein NM208_g14481 [Fusarium decemcellulare]